MQPISVLIVDDSALMRNLIRRMVDAEDDLETVGVAMNGLFAMKKIPNLKPDVIVLDLEMPEMDGITFLKERQKAGWDIPVVILSAVAKKGAAVTMQALSLGASDFITKPSGTPEENRAVAEQLTGMIRGYGREFRRTHGQTVPERRYTPPPKISLTTIEKTAPARRPTTIIQKDWPKLSPKKAPAPPEIVAIGISTGGPNALREVFARLHPQLPAPIVVVQHMPAGFTAEFANSLNKICPLEVKEAADGDIIKPGRALIAPGDRHLYVERKRLATVARLSDDENVNGHKPSAGVLFNSIANQYENRALAIIMTGMGKDGSREIGDIYEQGSITLAQGEKSCIVYGMPRVAVEHGYVSNVVELDEMADAINELAGALD